MSRRKAVWIALTVGMATVIALVIVDRLRRRPIASGTDWAPDPGPQSSVRTASAGTSTGEQMAEMANMAATSGQPAAEARPGAAEQPLAMWIRLTIVGVALLAFLAISLIAKSV
jgi:hypothetical protein